MFSSILLFLCFFVTVFTATANALETSGYAEIRGFYFQERASNSDPWVAGWATLLAKAEGEVGPAYAVAALRAEDRSEDGEGARWDPADRRLGRSALSLREAWTRLPLAEALDLQAGRFELGWGKTDGYSPADAFLPRDLTDPFADEKLPLWGLRLTGQRGAARFEAVGVPVTTPWRLPPLGSRYAPFGDGASFREEEDPPPGPGFGALRLLASRDAWDLGAWGRFGVRPAPLLSFSPDPASPDPLRPVLLVRREYAREQAAGLEVSLLADPPLLGALILRAEAAALFSTDPALGDARIVALSAEKSWADATFLLTFADNLMDTPVDPALLFDRAFLPALIAAWNQAAPWGNAKLVWTAGLAHGDGLLKAQAAWAATDALTLTLGGELPYGPADGPLGALSPARRLWSALRWAW